MRILHFRNLSNTAYCISRAERKLGFESYVANVKGADVFGFDYDFIIEEKSLDHLVGLLNNFDVYHLHSGDILPEAIDCIILKLLGKKVFQHYWGSDVRGRKPPLLHCLADFRIVHNLDLLPFVPDAQYIPIPVDLDVWKPNPRIKKKKGDSIVILHMPSDPYIKGTKSVVKAVERLKREGHHVKLLGLSRVPHKDMYRYYSQADIVVDQLLIGWYGRTTLEAMAMEKPVCVYVREDLEPYLPFHPYMNANPTNIFEKLKTLVEDEGLRKEFGTKGREFCREIHDSMKIAKQIVSYY